MALEQRWARLGLSWMRGRVEEMRASAKAAERDLAPAERETDYHRSRRVFAEALRKGATTIEEHADEYEAALDREKHEGTCER